MLGLLMVWAEYNYGWRECIGKHTKLDWQICHIYSALYHLYHTKPLNIGHSTFNNLYRLNNNNNNQKHIFHLTSWWSIYISNNFFKYQNIGEVLWENLASPSHHNRCHTYQVWCQGPQRPLLCHTMLYWLVAVWNEYVQLSHLVLSATKEN